MICFCKISNRTISEPCKIITWDFEDTLPLFSGTWLFVPLCRPPHYWSVSGGIASNKCTGPCEYIVTNDHLVAGTPGQVWCWTWPIQQAAVVCVWFVIYVSPSVSTQFMRVWISYTTAIRTRRKRERELSDKPQQEPLHGSGPDRIRSTISGWVNNCWTSQTDISANAVSNANDIGWNVSNFRPAQITAALTYKFEAATPSLSSWSSL